MSVVQDSGRGYHFIPSVRQYSAGVRATQGHGLHRCTFAELTPLSEGLSRAVEQLAGLGLPTHALCALELRSPRPQSEGAFDAFNNLYRKLLDQAGLLIQGANPIARTNVCPVAQAPDEPALHAFVYSAPQEDQGTAVDFVVSGSAEAPEARGSYRLYAAAPDDLTPDGIVIKANWVVDEMERRLDTLGASWSACSAVEVYTARSAQAALPVLDERVRSGRPATWHNAAPPVVGLEFEMDCRRVSSEKYLGD
ncbi:hypothetical protein [Kribbella catacumbae]|uniref:2-amino-5-chloromuconate deaminase CnbZ n=1 Tax=Kribbella catacumbae TaxID=460086 RepID=UPI00036A3344|nr:hypothetical protein [Kribbella catacumbae]